MIGADQGGQQRILKSRDILGLSVLNLGTKKRHRRPQHPKSDNQTNRAVRRSHSSELCELVRRSHLRPCITDQAIRDVGRLRQLRCCRSYLRPD